MHSLKRLVTITQIFSFKIFKIFVGIPVIPGPFEFCSSFICSKTVPYEILWNLKTVALFVFNLFLTKSRFSFAKLKHSSLLAFESEVSDVKF
jgi:hypothetical protein